MIRSFSRIRWGVAASPITRKVAARPFCDKKPPTMPPSSGSTGTVPKAPGSPSSAGTKVHDATPPPPPPPSGSGLGGFWLLLVGGLAGAGYYFRDEIGPKLGFGSSSSPDQPKDIKNVPETKREISDLESRLKKVSTAATTTPEVKQPVVPAPGQPTAASKSPVPQAEQANLSASVDWEKVREAVVNVLDDETYDDGSYGPLFVRLAWHNAGTYDKTTKTGGSEGAAMRFNEEPEAKWGANAGLDIARAKLEPIKQQFPGATYSDLWSFAGTVAIEELGGPKCAWRPGRKDKSAGGDVLPDGLLPDADGREHKNDPAKHVRFIFNRMGFNDQEMVALIGAHALGRCHTDRSGFWGPWTRAPTTFSNEFFRLLLEETWSKKKTHKGVEWTGPEQFESKDGELMMLPTDICLVTDPGFKKYVELYAKDEEKFNKDFAKAWTKLNENGVRKFNGWRKYIIFGERQ